MTLNAAYSMHHARGASTAVVCVCGYLGGIDIGGGIYPAIATFLMRLGVVCMRDALGFVWVSLLDMLVCFVCSVCAVAFSLLSVLFLCVLVCLIVCWFAL